MKQVTLGSSTFKVPAIIAGCMRIAELSAQEVEQYVLGCIEAGAYYFDHADIYGAGKSEALFGNVLKQHPQIREKVFLQSKCGIIPGKMYDFSKEHILKSVDASLARLQTEYLDMLLLHRPDALVEPEEVAEAFEILVQQGKVRRFGVSNQNPMQIELLKKYVQQPLLANQLQFSIPVSQMVAYGMEVNMNTEGSIDRDGGTLDYCRLKDITIQAWSPFQKPSWGGLFLDSEDYAPLNQTLQEIADQYGATKTMIAAAWILRHPAKMQIVAGTTKVSRMQEIIKASEIVLTREEWYRIYLASGHLLP